MRPSNVLRCCRRRRSSDPPRRVALPWDRLTRQRRDSPDPRSGVASPSGFGAPADHVPASRRFVEIGAVIDDEAVADEERRAHPRRRDVEGLEPVRTNVAYGARDCACSDEEGQIAGDPRGTPEGQPLASAREPPGVERDQERRYECEHEREREPPPSAAREPEAHDGPRDDEDRRKEERQGASSVAGIEVSETEGGERQQRGGDGPEAAGRSCLRRVHCSRTLPGSGRDLVLDSMAKIERKWRRKEKGMR